MDERLVANLKRMAAERAVDLVQNGMILGLGHGSTAKYAVDIIGERVKSGVLQRIVGVPTSEHTAAQARALGIPLATLAEHPVLDLAIDGADEVDPDLNLIKGLGGALLREKIVESAAQRFVVVVDESKLVRRLGTRGPLPVEVTQFAWEAHAGWLKSLGCRAELRRAADGVPFVTDNNNYIIHCAFPEGISDPVALARALIQRPGILEHGLFLGMATEVVVAGADGVRVISA
ncbi:MAG: ribose 5-phosphate isomerase A [Anaerolineales bacterium]|nr:MAG: ribose 5-phosphate isomerase A [Anaerolineales bacterium]